MYSENNKFDALIKSYLSGSSTQEETLELMSWVAESEENRAYFEGQKDVAAVWGLTDFAMPEIDEAGVEAALHATNAKIDAEEIGAKVVEMPWLRRNYKYVAGVAAALVVALFIGFLVRPTDSPITLASNEQSVEQAFLLPDGTSVTFDGEAEISYPKQFSKTLRSVDFEGTALFDVVKEEGKPFVIHCPNVDVEVLGTSFLLSATSERVSLDLYTGLVKMTSYDGKGKEVSHLIVNPGERGVMQGQGELKVMTYPEIKAEELKNDRVLDFNNVDLATIVETLEYVYGIEIELDEIYASNKLTARFTDQETVDEVLETVAAVFDFELVKEDGVYLLQ